MSFANHAFFEPSLSRAERPVIACRTPTSSVGGGRERAGRHPGGLAGGRAPSESSLRASTLSTVPEPVSAASNSGQFASSSSFRCLERGPTSPSSSSSRAFQCSSLRRFLKASDPHSSGRTRVAARWKRLNQSLLIKPITTPMIAPPTPGPSNAAKQATSRMMSAFLAITQSLSVVEGSIDVSLRGPGVREDMMHVSRPAARRRPVVAIRTSGGFGPGAGFARIRPTCLPSGSGRHRVDR